MVGGLNNMTELGALTALIIEPDDAIRSSMRSMLMACGLSQIDDAHSASMAILPLRLKTFDFLFCEYNLGPGQDGQQLLEDLRRHKIIPLSTIFIMTTTERGLEKVVSAAEFAPSDYLLKPINVEGLRERISRAIAKREVFLRVYQLMGQGYQSEAIALCLQCETSYPQYATDFMRLRAEMYLELHEPEQARAIYQYLIEAKNIAWARLGLAITWYMQQRYAQSKNVLKLLVAEHPQFLDAYDWLAKAHTAIGHMAQAQAVLEVAVRISPHSLGRLRELGAMALEASDLVTAERILKQVVDKARYSEFRDPEDNVRLVKTLIGKGDAEQAIAVLQDMEKSMEGIEKVPACHAISAAMVYEFTGDTERLSIALTTAVAACRDMGSLSADLKMELARKCLHNKQDEEASEVVLDVMKNAQSTAVMQKAMAIFEKAGRHELADSLANESRRQVINIVAAGAAKAREGDYPGAVVLMSEAVKKLPNNPLVVFNATVAVLKHLQNMGWEDKLGEQARSLIEIGRRLDAGNPRLIVLAGLYHEILLKYGVKAGRALLTPAKK